MSFHLLSRSRPFLLSRPFSTQQPKKPSNYPFLFLGAGTAGLVAYFLLNRPVHSPPHIQQASPLDPKNFVDFKLKKITPYNHNTSKFTFELPNNEASLIPITSCLVVRTPDPTDPEGKPVIRPYTPISHPETKGELTLLVKKYEAGKASRHIHSLKEGDVLPMKGPIDKFPYKLNELDKVALLGGGSGITPLLQLLTATLPNPENKTHFTLIFANVTPSDILLRSELDVLKARYADKFDIVYVVEKDDDKGGKWDGPKGYITSDLIKKHVAPPSLGDKVKVFVCGPPPQVAALAGKKDGMKQGELDGILRSLGYNENQVFKF